MRWVMIVVVAVLATAVPAGAQQSAGPDAAPTGSNAPRPDPAPVKSTPKVTVVRPAARPVVTPTVRPVAPVAATPVRRASKPVHRATTERKEPVRHQQRAQAAKRRPRAAMPPLPRLSLAHLSAPPTNDAGRARKLAAGALSLLVLALASATLLAFTARVERRRVVR